MLSIQSSRSPAVMGGSFRRGTGRRRRTGDWRRFFEVNVLSGVRLRRHYIGPMRQKNWRRIVFISSESGLQDSQGTVRRLD
jgi:NAD(P)-dependent dehydrogenase (short-subunit alcohol dehydrogenase family)